MRQQLYLAFLAGMNVLIAFLTQLVVFTRIGPGMATDAFIAAATVPQMFAMMIGISLSSVLVPLFAGEEQKSQRVDGWSILYLVGCTFTVIALILFCTAHWWVGFLFPGFNSETHNLCVYLARIQVFSMLFISMGAVTTAVYYARNQFKCVEVWTLIPSMLSVVIMYLLLPLYGIVIAAWVVLIKSFVLLIVLLPVLGRPVNFKGITPPVRIVWQRVRPILASNMYYKSDVLVDRYLLSMGTEGDISLFALAQQLYSAANNVLGKVWGATAIPKLSVFFKTNNCDGFLGFYWRRLSKLFLAVSLFYVLIIIIGKPALSLSLGVGRMNAHNIQILWQFLVILGGMFVIGCPGVLMSGGYYALGDTRTPTKISVVTFTIFCFFKIISFNIYGVYGLAATVSVYYVMNAILFLIPFNKITRKAFLATKAN